MKHLVDAETMAAQLSLKTPTVRLWTRTKGLPCVWIGTRLRFDPDEVMNGFENNSRPAKGIK